MQLSSLDRRVEELVGELMQFRGHRTVWLDLKGRLVHSEPDEELEVRGYLYVTTVLRPDRETLLDATARFVSVAPARRGVVDWETTDTTAANLAPA